MYLCASVCVFFGSGFKLEKSVECFAFQVSDFLPVNLKRQIFSYVFFSICNFQCSQIVKIQVAEILISIYDIQKVLVVFLKYELLSKLQEPEGSRPSKSTFSRSHHTFGHQYGKFVRKRKGL